MATISLTVVAEPNNTPPRIRVNVTDSGSPAINSVTVTRLDPSGRIEQVRTQDGNPLVLTTSGSNRTATIFDYEMPLGAPVTYSTVERPAVTVAASVDSSRVWLVHPGVPSLSMPVDFRAGSFESEEYTVNSGVFYPLGRRNAIVITDGQRKEATGSFTVATETLAELASLQTLIDDAGPLLLNVPTSMALGVETAYVAIRDVSVRRLSTVGMDPHRDVVMPYTVVDAPVGGSQSAWQWANVTAQYSTWSALMAGEPTWADVLAPTN